MCKKKKTTGCSLVLSEIFYEVMAQCVFPSQMFPCKNKLEKHVVFVIVQIKSKNSGAIFKPFLRILGI